MNIYDVGMALVEQDGEEVAAVFSPSAVSVDVQVAAPSVSSFIIGLPGLQGPTGPAGPPGPTGGGTLVDATTTSKGAIMLSGDLSGTAGEPVVPAVRELDSMLDLTLMFEGALI